MELGEQIVQLESDLQEVKGLLGKSQRTRVQALLGQEQKKLEKEIELKQQQMEKQVKEASDATKAQPASATKGYTVKINSYGWDQSDKYVKIYITLSGVHKIPAENVEAAFTEKSFVVLVKDLDGKNHQMTINNLLWPISVEESCRKVKKDMVLVMCKKKTQKKWECLTQVEMQTKEKEKPKLEDNSDPSEGIMNVLKKIYSEGDDEMKRTINKAWSESQEKRGKGEGLDF